MTNYKFDITNFWIILGLVIIILFLIVIIGLYNYINYINKKMENKYEVPLSNLLNIYTPYKSIIKFNKEIQTDYITVYEFYNGYPYIRNI